MIEIDPDFTISTRTPPYRDAGLPQELYDALKSLDLPE